MKQEKIIKDLLTLLPHWHYKIDKTFKQSLEHKMSLEVYYCLQTMRTFGPMTMSELAARMKIKKQQATKMVTKLYEHGLVKRIQDEQDRRFIHIEVTETAIRYIEQDYYHNTEFLEQLQERIGENEVAAFGEAVATILRILSAVD